MKVTLFLSQCVLWQPSVTSVFVLDFLTLKCYYYTWFPNSPFGNPIAQKTLFLIPMRSRYKIIDKDGIYFTTSTIVEWLPIFTSLPYFNIIIESLKHCMENKSLKLYAYVIMDNHFHLIVSAPELSKTLQDLKKFTAHQIIDILKKDNKQWLLNQFTFYKKRYKSKSKHQVWQEGSHPELLMSPDMFVQKAEYIHYNPVKRGLVDLPEHWRFSSARNYLLDDHSIIEVDLSLH